MFRRSTRLLILGLSLLSVAMISVKNVSAQNTTVTCSGSITSNHCVDVNNNVLSFPLGTSVTMNAVYFCGLGCKAGDTATFTWELVTQTVPDVTYDYRRITSNIALTVASGTSAGADTWTPDKKGAWRVEVQIYDNGGVVDLGGCPNPSPSGSIGDPCFDIVAQTGTVGGVLVPVDKLALLAPFMGIASLILTATTVTVVHVRHTRQRR